MVVKKPWREGEKLSDLWGVNLLAIAPDRFSTRKNLDEK
jgi:hypothetical protein